VTGEICTRWNERESTWRNSGHADEEVGILTGIMDRPLDLAVTRPNQVWAMDITYIPMARGFVYLAAVVDWFSRRVIAWRLSNTMREMRGQTGRSLVFRDLIFYFDGVIFRNTRNVPSVPRFSQPSPSAR
jgi:transposase InsO family protein